MNLNHSIRFGTFAFALFLGATFLSGCSSGSSNAQNSAGTDAPTQKLLVGVVFDSGGIGDKSFNDSANAGLQRAVKELDISPKTVQSASEKDYAINLSAMADAGCKVVFAVGLNQGNALKEVAAKYPNTKFAIIDGSVSAPNVRSLGFAEEQGSFLAGYLAGLTSKTQKIGFVGGQELDLIKKFYVGFAAGAKSASKTIEVLPAKYVGDWDNVDSAHADALQLFGSGADIVYHAAGRAGLGVINAAKEQGKYAIGVDSDQDGVAPGSVLTSMVKHVDEAVYQTIKDVKDGKFVAGSKVYDLASNGVGLSSMTYTKEKLPAGALEKLKVVRDQIVAGKIKVPATAQELAAFRVAN